jgi:hypothetical protein
MGEVNPGQLSFDFSGLEKNSSNVHHARPVTYKPLSMTENSLEVKVDKNPKEKPKEEFKFEPKVDGSITDYTEYPPIKMYIANEKTVKNTERPAWIPLYDTRFIKRNYFMPPVMKIGQNYVMMADQGTTKYYKMSLDGLASTIDYYIKQEKAERRDDAKRKNDELLDTAKKALANDEKALALDTYRQRYYKAVLEGKKVYKPRPLRILSTMRMTNDQMGFLLRNNMDKERAWKSYLETRREIEQKMNDMSCQLEDLESTYTKGAKTSYGDKNTSKALLKEYGILVKRQNGDAINTREIEEIRNAFTKLVPVFGNLKDICSEYGLKISHSGDKNMHARKAIGLFFNAFKAIGVQFGNKEKNHLILAHELSHFLDCQAGMQKSHFYASDQGGTFEDQIAKLFRSKMNKDKAATRDSKYLNRTCECFARAMEQYAAFIVSPIQYYSYAMQESYMNDREFRRELMPLIEGLVKERDSFWHGGLPQIRNSPEKLKEIMDKAKEEAGKNLPKADLGSMDDATFSSITQISAERYLWFQKKGDEYSTCETLPSNISDFYLGKEHADQFLGLVRDEFYERFTRQGATIFPIFPTENTLENFKSNVQKLAGMPAYQKHISLSAIDLCSKSLASFDMTPEKVLSTLGCTNTNEFSSLMKKWAEEACPKKIEPAKKEMGSSYGR